MLPLCEHMGKRPMLSVYILLVGYSQICSSPEGRTDSVVCGDGLVVGTEGVLSGLVDLTP